MSRPGFKATGRGRFRIRTPRAAQPDPAAVAAPFAQALALHQAGRLVEAEAIYRRILEAEPGHFDSLHNVGLIYYQRGEHIAALRQIDAALRLAPNATAAHNNRGVALAALQRLDEAVESYGRAIALAPDYVDALINRGNALKDLNRLDEALASYDKAIALSPGHAVVLVKRGNVLQVLQRLEEAVTSYDRAVALKPDFSEAWNNRGIALGRLRRTEEAQASLARAVELRPDDAEAKSNYFHGRMQLCDWTDFGAMGAELNAAIDKDASAVHPFQLLGFPSTPAAQLKCARNFIRTKCAAYSEPVWRGERYAHQRIRIAYLSADLRDHPVAHLTVGMFAHHDRSRFETVAISFGDDKPSPTREQLKPSFDRFRDARTMSDWEVARLIRDLEIDIAVDLNGHTDGSRPNVLALRPAPVQVNYLGFAGTLGSQLCDYIIADRFVIPEKARAHYAENVVYLPDSFMVNDDARKVSARRPPRVEAGLPETGFVFCCFNNSYKITPDVFDVWMRLLKGIEGSVLWLSAAPAHAPDNLRREAEKRGVGGDRLVFAPRVPLNEDHLARVCLADLFLDTLYYNAHATAADALWAGVPVLTCPGATFASRVAGSLLGAVGLPELITGSLADYEALALRLARDPQRLAALRQKLVRNRNTYPLFDTDRFTRHMEAAYTTMWERAERGERPQSFAVGPIERGPP